MHVGATQAGTGSQRERASLTAAPQGVLRLALSCLAALRVCYGSARVFRLTKAAQMKAQAAWVCDWESEAWIRIDFLQVMHLLCSIQTHVYPLFSGLLNLPRCITVWSRRSCVMLYIKISLVNVADKQRISACDSPPPFGRQCKLGSQQRNGVAPIPHVFKFWRMLTWHKPML